MTRATKQGVWGWTERFSKQYYLFLFFFPQHSSVFFEDRTSSSGYDAHVNLQHTALQAILQILGGTKYIT